MMTNDLKIKLLRGALDVLDGGKRWVKGVYQADDDKFCLAGAMFESACREGLIIKKEPEDDFSYTEYEDSLFGETTSELGSIADRYTKEVSLSQLAQLKGFIHVPDFNDNASTTYRDVEQLVQERIAMIERETDG